MENRRQSRKLAKLTLRYEKAFSCRRREKWFDRQKLGFRDIFCAFSFDFHFRPRQALREGEVNAAMLIVENKRKLFIPPCVVGEANEIFKVIVRLFEGFRPSFVLSFFEGNLISLGKQSPKENSDL